MLTLQVSQILLQLHRTQVEMYQQVLVVLVVVMKKTIIATCFVFLGFLSLNTTLVNASEITGTISNESYQGSMTGNVVSTPAQSYGGGGGGGSIVVPAESYSYGSGNYNQSYGNVALASQPMAPTYTKKIAQANDNYINSVPTNTATSESDFLPEDSTTTSATDTMPTMYEDADMMATQTDTVTEGPYDFFGISAWFWLVVLLLLILITAVLYMQKI